MLELALKWLMAYLLGSLMGALLIGRLKGVDIREQGSGNAGGTNALRTQGKAFALGVVVIDVAKGWFAAGVLPALAAWFVVVCATGFVGFGTTVAMATLPVQAWLAQAPLATLCLSLALTAFVAWAHRSNFARMRAGTENRASKLWLFAPKA